MAAQPSRRRGPASPPARRTVKTSLILDADLHAKLGVAASLSGQDRNAFAVEVLRQALSGIVIIDRRKSTAHGDPSGEEGSASAA